MVKFSFHKHTSQARDFPAMARDIQLPHYWYYHLLLFLHSNIVREYIIFRGKNLTLVLSKALETHTCECAWLLALCSAVIGNATLPIPSGEACLRCRCEFLDCSYTQPCTQSLFYYFVWRRGVSNVVGIHPFNVKYRQNISKPHIKVSLIIHFLDYSYDCFPPFTWIAEHLLFFPVH